MKMLSSAAFTYGVFTVLVAAVLGAYLYQDHVKEWSRELLVFWGGAGMLHTEIHDRVPVTYKDNFHPTEGTLYEYPDFEILSLGTTGSFPLFEVETVGNYGNLTYHFKVYEKEGKTSTVSYQYDLPGKQVFFVVNNEPFVMYSVLGVGGLAIEPAPFTECNAGPCRAD